MLRHTNLQDVMALPEKQILAFFAETFNQKLEVPDLRAIKRETVEECLISLLSVIYGFDDNFFVNDESDPQRRTTLLVCLMQRTIEDLQKDCELVFNMSDLLDPQWRRIRVFFSMLINFYKFFCQQIGFIDEVFDEVNKFEQNQAEVQKSIDNVRNICDRQAEVNQQDERSIEELTAVQHSANAEFIQLKTMKEELKAEALRREELVNAKEAAVAELSSTLKDLAIESQNLDYDIITSPEQLFSDIEHSEAELKQVRENIGEIRRQCREQDRLKHDAEALREKGITTQSEISTTIKSHLDVVAKYRSDEAESAESLKIKQDRLLEMERDHNDYRTELENENVSLLESIKVTEEKTQSVLQQNGSYVEIAEKIEKYDFASEMNAKSAQLKSINDATTKIIGDMNAYLSQCITDENILNERIVSAENQYQHMVKFADACVKKVKTSQSVVELENAIDYISTLENKKLALLEKNTF